MEEKSIKEVIKINPQDYGVESKSAVLIQEMFAPMINELVELEDEYNTIVSKPIEEEVCKEAKQLLKKYVKVRTSTAKIHKELKVDNLKQGRFIDSWKNTQIIATEKIELKLKSISEHFQNIENERIAKIQTERANELLKYDIKQIPNDLGKMDNMIWDNLLKGVKKSYEDEQIRLKQEQEQEQERLKQERLKQEAIKQEQEQERLRLKAENEKIKAENEKIKAENELVKAESKPLANGKQVFDKILSSNIDEYNSLSLINYLEEAKTKYKFKNEHNKQMFSKVSAGIDKLINFINTNKK